MVVSAAAALTAPAGRGLGGPRTGIAAAVTSFTAVAFAAATVTVPPAFTRTMAVAAFIAAATVAAAVAAANRVATNQAQPNTRENKQKNPLHGISSLK